MSNTDTKPAEPSGSETDTTTKNKNKIKIGINGFGRIGRLVLRASLRDQLLRDEVQVVAVNDPNYGDNMEYMAYNFKYDSTHGTFKGEVKTRERNKQNYLIINNNEDNEITISTEREPELIDWKKSGAEYIVEASGIHTSVDQASTHLETNRSKGAKKVVITAPSMGVPSFVYGVNHESYDPSQNVVANSSCTTNCLAPIAKVINDNFTIIEGFATSVHAVTSEQKVVDASNYKFRSLGRCLQNIIPTETGAQEIGKIITELDQKVTATAFRVPVYDVSVVDFTVRVEKPTTPEEIRQKIKEASIGSLKGILGYTEDSVVSSDFITDERSCVFDSKSLLSLNGNGQFFKLICWYDNEYAYACRVIDIIKHMHSVKVPEVKA